MKIFYRKVILFILLMSSILFTIIYVIDQKIKENTFYSLPSNTKYLFIGSSFVSHSINDEKIEGVLNMALAGESYFYSYIKINKLIGANPDLQTLFLDYSNFRLTDIADTHMWDRVKFSYKYSKFHTIADNRERWFVFKHNPIGFLSVLSTIYRENIIFLKQGYKFYPSYRHWGNYDSFNFSKVDSLINVNYQNKWSTNEIFGIGNVNLEYLLKIKDLCSRNKIELILFRPPTHQSDPFRANEELFQKYRKEYLSDITFLDFQNFPLKNDEFLDLDHLNAFGSAKFSLFLDELFKDSLWIVNDKQKYIDRKVNQLNSNVVLSLQEIK